MLPSFLRETDAAVLNDCFRNLRDGSSDRRNVWASKLGDIIWHGWPSWQFEETSAGLLLACIFRS